MPLPVNIKNIDLKDLLKNKTLVLNIVVILSVLVISGYIYSKQNNINRNIKRRILSETESNDLFKQLSTLEKEISHYKEILSKKETSSIINTLSSLVQEAGLSLISIKPEDEQDYDSYIKSSISLKIFSDDYHKIGNFISKLESSSDLYKIVTLNIQSHRGRTEPELQEEGQGQQERQEKSGLYLELMISRITFKG